ncbi:MAG TPA: HIT family protein [Phycisphaerales bacterium]|nr:HIT family protein [Phycisphaerales bacterium]
MKADCPLCARLVASEPLTLIAELRHTVVFLNDQQGCPGWCVCVLKEHVEHMDELPVDVQREVFGEVARVARAIRSAFPASGARGGPPRINYECLGNVTSHVHWHVIPRHAGDPTPNATVWGWDAAALRGAMSAADRDVLAARIRAEVVGAG